MSHNFTFERVKEGTKCSASALPFEIEFRVSRGHLEFWRFWEDQWNERGTCRLRFIGRARLRKGGRKLPKSARMFRKISKRKVPHHIRSAFGKTKAHWKEAECPKSWTCRFDAFAIVGMGVLQDRSYAVENAYQAGLTPSSNLSRSDWKRA